MLLAMAITPDNTPHGYNLTFAFPMLMFIIISVALYLRLRSSHRVPGHVTLGSVRWANPEASELRAHSSALAAQPVAAATADADPGEAVIVGGATLAAEVSDTTAGSTLQEDTAQESTAQESTEDSE
jgi:hypothetical protein